MAPGHPTRVIAACLALAGFVIAIISGLAAGNPAEDILLRALLALVGCNLVGWCIGTAGERSIRERIASLVRAAQAPALATPENTQQDSSNPGAPAAAR